MPRALTDQERARLAGCQRVLQHAVAVSEAPEGIEQAQKAGYPELSLAPEDAAAFAEAETRRIHVYRKLVHATLKDVVALEIPRAVARMGQVAYERTLAAWLVEELPRSQILRDVPYELSAWASPRWRRDATLPPYLADLARFELFEFDVYTAEREPPAWASRAAPSDELSADQTLAFDGTVRIARFDHAVHELPDDADDRTEPTARPSGVLAYRDSGGRYRQLDLTPLATAIFGAVWRQGAPLATAIQQACQARGRAIDRDVIDGTSRVLEDLAERGAVLGGIATTSSDPPAPSPWAHWLFGDDAAT